VADFLGGRYWDRTSGPCRVNRSLSTDGQEDSCYYDLPVPASGSGPPRFWRDSGKPLDCGDAHGTGSRFHPRVG
jgi:hypothetical protein